MKIPNNKKLYYLLVVFLLLTALVVAFPYDFYDSQCNKKEGDQCAICAYYFKSEGKGVYICKECWGLYEPYIREVVYLNVEDAKASSFDTTPDWAPNPNPMSACDRDITTRWSSELGANKKEEKMKEEKTKCNECGKDLFDDHDSKRLKLNEGLPSERMINLGFIHIERGIFHSSTTIGYESFPLSNLDFCDLKCMRNYIRKLIAPRMMGQKHKDANDEILGE